MSQQKTEITGFWAWIILALVILGLIDIIERMSALVF